MDVVGLAGYVLVVRILGDRTAGCERDRNGLYEYQTGEQDIYTTLDGDGIEKSLETVLAF